MNKIDEYTAWADVPANLKTKTQLSKEGMKPAKGQVPVAQFCSYYYGKRRPRYYDLYDIAQAAAKRTMTPAQKEALQKARAAATASRTCTKCGRVVGRKRDLDDGLCEWCALAAQQKLDCQAAAAWAQKILETPAAVILDVETTGLDYDAEIVQIAVIDLAGKTLFDSLLRPAGPIPQEATEIHGITDDQVQDAPLFVDIYARLSEILAKTSAIIAYNVDFDRRMLQQTCERYELPEIAASWECAMEMYATFYGQWSDYWESYRWQQLTNACWQLGIKMDWQAHTALGDCHLTLAVIQAMAVDVNEREDNEEKTSCQESAGKRIVQDQR